MPARSGNWSVSRVQFRMALVDQQRRLFDEAATAWRAATRRMEQERMKLTHLMDMAKRAVVVALVIVATRAAAEPAGQTYNVDLAWSAPAVTNGCDGYVVYCRNATLQTTTTVQLGKVFATTVTNLSFGSTYEFRVTARSADGIEGDYSEPVVKQVVRPGKPTIRSVLLRLSGR